MKAVTQQENTQPQSFSLGTVMFKATALAILFVIGSFFVLAMIGLTFGYRYLKQVSITSGKTPQQLMQLAKIAIDAPPREENPVFFILGTDNLSTRGDVPPLTDTMMLASLNLKTGVINLLPLPRDIWNKKYKTKINALYAYGIERNPDNPTLFPRQVIENMTQIPISYALVIDMETLSNFVDVVSGIPIEVPTSFKDDMFPNPKVDIRIEKDAKKLYKTVIFTKGEEIMSGDRFLEFVRSRHSDSEEGSDRARSIRQQIALKALMRAVTKKSLLKQPATLGKLLSLYENSLATTLPINDMASIGKTLLHNSATGISIKSHVLSVQSQANSGVIFHPDPRTTNNIWVYEITDQQLFSQEVGRALDML